MNTLRIFSKNALRAACVCLLFVFAASCSGSKTPADDQNQKAELPEVTWIGISKITSSGATLSAEIVSDGNLAIKSCGFCYIAGFAEVPTLDNALSVSADSHGLGPYEVNLTGLSPETSFAVRAWVKTDAGVGYSDARAFTTTTTANGNGGGNSGGSLSRDDILGTYSYSVKVLTGSSSGTISKTSKSWPGVTIEGDGDENLVRVIGLSSYSEGEADMTVVAIGYFDKSANEVCLLGSWYNLSYIWWYGSDDSQKYLSVFYPITPTSMTDTSVSWNYLSTVDVGGYSASGIIRLKAENSGGIVLTPVGDSVEQPYLFIDYTYDTSSGTMGSSIESISSVYEVVKLTKTGAATSSVTKKSQYGKQTTPERGSFQTRVLR